MPEIPKPKVRAPEEPLEPRRYSGLAATGGMMWNETELDPMVGKPLATKADQAGEVDDD